MQPETVAIIGYGYTGSNFANRLANLGFKIYGTTRTKQTDHTNITLLPFTDETVITLLEKANYLLISIPPNDNDAEPFLTHYSQQLIQQKNHFKWIGYLSSTGVYGDHQGRWVTETSPCFPTNQQGIKRLQAEEAWLMHYKKHQLPIHVFRLAGIYGPSRNSLEKIKAGKTSTVYKPNQVFSRIHVEDISEALYQSLQSPMSGEIFNLCDDFPAPLHEVEQFAASLLNHPPLKEIPFEQANLSPMGRSFFESNRYVSNQKIKEKLSFTFTYPTFKEGLNQLLKDL